MGTGFVEGRVAKVGTLGDAIERIPDGAHLALTGFAISRNAVTLALGIVRSGRRRLNVTQVIGGIETDLLAGSGCLERLVCAGGSLDRFGPLHSVNRGIASGDITVEEHSGLSLTLRLHAAYLGLPFIPARSMLGSDLLDRLTGSGVVRMGNDPFTGSPVALLSPARPDVAVVHADLADELGNTVVSGPLGALRETALAAAEIIVTCEQVVPPGIIPPDRVTIPGVSVTTVVPVPRGAAPTAVFEHYDFDRDALTAYARAAAQGGDAYDEFVDELASSGASLP